MTRAIEEPKRRRRLQGTFNKKHGITPQTVVKSLGSPLVRVYEADYHDVPLAAEQGSRFGSAELPRMIRQLKQEMKQAAGQLEFGKAAELRDRIHDLEKRELALREAPAEH